MLAEFERELLFERTQAGLKAARGKKGGRPRKMDEHTLTMTMSAMADQNAIAYEVSKRLGITTATFYSHVNGDGSLKAPGEKLLSIN